MTERIYKRRLPTSKNWAKSASGFASFGSFKLSQTHADGSHLMITGDGLSALILAIGAALGISAIWGMIQVFAY
ncbi:hypothetical protein [Tritonibacter sp. SIMBA_163]|uniref:hypothetical protein n=1 Tax=Tritonibacter sp. SIMBA_163 TaxID=3080868 RepID=UPI00397EFA47